MGSFYGALDYIAANAQKELSSQLFIIERKAPPTIVWEIYERLTTFTGSHEACPSFEVPEFSIAKKVYTL